MLLSLKAFSQENTHTLREDSSFIRLLYDSALLKGQSYENLRYLCKNIGHRLTGSKQAEQAVYWSLSVMQNLNFDTVYLQEIEAPFWERGSEYAFYRLNGKREALHISTLGGSIGTDGILEAEIVEVQSLKELDSLGAMVKGKIVFYNRAMDKRLINTFQSYGGCVDQRYWGAVEAAKHGAIAVIVRSLTTLTDEHPHTGSMTYKEGIPRIPAIAVSTSDADKLHEMYKNNIKFTLGMELSCILHNDVKTYNVIGEIRGRINPDQFLLVGGHLDSWDKGEGAHDDGAGVVQSIEAARLLMATGYTLSNSLRVVLFMNEENGNMGGKSYASLAKEKMEKHLFALESDNGGFSPRGFHMQASDAQVVKMQSFRPVLEPYGLHMFERGYAGVDIYPLIEGDNKVVPNMILMGLKPDPQRYFDYHHTDTDVFENVNARELELGGASMAAILYLVDRYWTEL